MSDRHDIVRRRRASAVAAVAVLVALGAFGVSAIGNHRRSGRASGDGSRSAALPRGDAWPARPHRRRTELAAIERLARRMPYISSGGRRRRQIALTFDDGPGPYTLSVLRVLRRTHTPATFFQIGFMIHDFPQVERALLADRHVVLGDHTETHPMLTRLPANEQYGQLDDAAGMAALHHAPRPHLFRPPYGAFNDATLQATRRLHMLIVLWTVDSEDYRQPGVRTIVTRVLDGARPGAIVLLHDAGGTRTQTIQALPTIIRRLRRRRYRLVSVPRLLRDDAPRTAQPRPTGGIG
jgi:peptidoglycan/xylan/chitin deacetylase (PgdA/CDA1 family)